MTIDTVARHPILRCIDEIASALDSVADVEPAYMRTDDKRTALVELARLETRLNELRFRVLAGADEVGAESGARDAADWVAHATQADLRAARSDRHLARKLRDRPLVTAGLRTGKVSTAQAHAIVNGIAELPTTLGPELTAQAEETLVGYAEHHRPGELRRLARRILDVVAPEISEAEDAKALEAEERRANEKASLRFQDIGGGRTRIWGSIPTPTARRLQTYLEAWTSPRQSGEPMPQHRAYAHALGALLEHLDPDRLPEHGGSATTLFVTLTHEQLTSELATADLVADDGTTSISAQEARRLACQASIIPVVLGGKSEVLDLGRSRRLYTAAQHKAARLRDRRCRAEGCTIPASWTELHHRRPWSEGGATDLDNAACLCTIHHHRIHDRRYEHRWLSSGDVRFHLRE